MNPNNKEKSILIEKIKKILNHYSKGKYEFICRNSPNFIRNILNSLISNLLDVEIDNTFLIHKKNQRALLYFELRILINLRSNYFDIDKFKSIVYEISNLENSSQYFYKVDLQLLEALPIFKTYINDSIKIDKLIKIHQYVSSLWKNGSKFLHFYTLHNEEHSLELIKQSITITKTIDYLKLKSEDYYILFLACYLHDISMVLHPDLESFSSENMETDLICSEWKRDIYEILNINLEKSINNEFVTKIEHVEKSELKKILLKYFKKIDNFFENKIRETHASQSADFIKKQNYLKFIDNAFIQLVADVSEGHYYDSKDVYKLKSKAKKDLFDIKYLMIILRLADLLDMTRDRISPSFMKQNIKHMSGISKYHWISHLSINNCHLESEFHSKEHKKNAGNNNDLYIEEVIKVIIHLNTCQLTKVSNYESCKNWYAKIDNDNKITIKINDHTNKVDSQKCSLPCNLSCKWFVKKQEYLFKELYELQKYLNRNTNNIFKTNFQVELHFDSVDCLPQEYIDFVIDYI